MEQNTIGRGGGGGGGMSSGGAGGFTDWPDACLDLLRTVQMLPVSPHDTTDVKCSTLGTGGIRCVYRMDAIFVLFSCCG